jgi:hypothetical protein
VTERRSRKAAKEWCQVECNTPQGDEKMIFGSPNGWLSGQFDKDRSQAVVSVNIT